MNHSSAFGVDDVNAPGQSNSHAILMKTNICVVQIKVQWILCVDSGSVAYILALLCGPHNANHPTDEIPASNGNFHHKPREAWGNISSALGHTSAVLYPRIFYPQSIHRSLSLLHTTHRYVSLSHGRSNNEQYGGLSLHYQLESQDCGKSQVRD